MRTIKILLSLTVLYTSISKVSAQMDLKSIRPYEKCPEVKSIADFVALTNSENKELAALCDACFERSKDVQFVAKKLNFKVKPASIMFDSSSDIPDTGTCGGGRLPKSILDQMNLSQTEKIMIFTIFRNNREAVTTAYREYSVSFKNLPTSLEAGNRLQVMKLFSNAKASRSRLIELCGAEAIVPLDEHRGAADIIERCEKIARERATTEEIVKNFRATNPDMAALCDACLERSSDIQFLTKKYAEKLDQFGELNPLILAANALPPFTAQYPMAPNISSSQLALTSPNLEPSYPTLEKRSAVCLLPSKARNDNLLQSLNGVQGNSEKKARLSATEMIMLFTLVRNSADKLRNADGNYRSCALTFEPDFRFNKLQPSASRAAQSRISATAFVKARKSLVDLCGEKAVCEVDVRNNFAVLVKHAAEFTP